MQQFTATDKITQKMTHDGAAETNKATEEQTCISRREANTDFFGGTASGMAEKITDRIASGTKPRNNKRKHYK